ncbi:MAG: hypothetical protein JOZ62_12000 [Acidobacteriaceae bacterium]|nr:hypothetical protein [Acidobacteriaceae bacterium]
MQKQNVRELHEQWQSLVTDYASARREAERDRRPAAYLRGIDDSYGFRIDVAYHRLKDAERAERVGGPLVYNRSLFVN